MGEAEFWRLTLAQFDELARRQRKKAEAADYRAAVVTAAVLNTIPRGKGNEDKIFHPWDIFPGYDWEPETEPPGVDEMIIRTAAMGGEIIEKDPHP